MKTGFDRHEKGKLVYYTIEAFDKTGLVKHGFSTRHGGVSTGECKSLNLGVKRKDTRENILENYNIFCSELGIDAKKLVLSNQVHENKVCVVTKEDWGKGLYRESDIVGVDALVCGESGVPFMVFCADCVCVYFLDVKKKVAGLAHSGWRSTVKNICGCVIDKMHTEFGCERENIICAIAPSIGQCCFEVDKDVADLFDESFVEKRGVKYHVDLWGVIYKQLTDKGIKDENITLAGMCTCCNRDEFFSNRAHKGKMGHMGAVMELI